MALAEGNGVGVAHRSWQQTLSKALEAATLHAAWPYYGEGKAEMATQAAEAMFVLLRSDKRNAAWKEIGGHATGDVLVIPTEAGIDSYLFWSGGGYQSLEVLDEP